MNIICTYIKTLFLYRSDECSVPVIEHASFEVLGHDYLQGQPIPNYSIVKFTCNEGFTLPANHNMAYGYCISGSFNFTSLPKCIRKDSTRLLNINTFFDINLSAKRKRIFVNSLSSSTHKIL